MKIKNKVQTEVEVLVAVECDRCKKVYTDIYEIQEFLCINFTGGYASVFGDMNKIDCDICQHCLKEMINGIYREVEL